MDENLSKAIQVEQIIALSNYIQKLFQTDNEFKQLFPDTKFTTLKPYIDKMSSTIWAWYCRFGNIGELLKRAVILDLNKETV